MDKKIIGALVAVVIIAGAVFVIGCVVPTEEEEQVTAMMSFIPVTDWNPFYVAIDKGYYADEGLDVTMQYSTEGSMGPIKQVGSGKTQFGIVLAPLIVIWLGFDISSKIALAALIVFFPIFVNMVTGVRSVDRNLLELMKSTGASKFDIFKKIELPSILPMLFAGFKTGITLAVIGAVVGEFVGANAGLGYLTIYASGLMDTAQVFVAILQLTLLGIVLYAIVCFIEKKLMPWHETEKK